MNRMHSYALVFRCIGEHNLTPPHELFTPGLILSLDNDDDDNDDVLEARATSTLCPRCMGHRARFGSPCQSRSAATRQSVGYNTRGFEGVLRGASQQSTHCSRSLLNESSRSHLLLAIEVMPSRSTVENSLHFYSWAHFYVGQSHNQDSRP